ncbi:MAG: radical SAM protein [Bellilinea sp.]
MKKTSAISIHLDEHGHLILPEEVLKLFGPSHGSEIRAELSEQGLVIRHSTSALARVYIEPTNACNLGCRTCMRNVWDEPIGKMSTEIFSSILKGIQSFTPLPMVFFGGYGEPLAHPDILDMIAAVRNVGAKVEMITNGTMLNETTASRLVELGLNRLWVSIDGATPASYADVRLGDLLPLVLANLTRLQNLSYHSRLNLPKLGIAFVAMQRNIADLPEVVRMVKLLGADQFSVSNVLPHTHDLCEQVLFARSMYESDLQPSKWGPEVSLPRMDPTTTILDCVKEILKGGNELLIARQSLGMGAKSCPFLEKDSISIRWDGAVSPCLPLLHTHVSYLADVLRTSHAYLVGNVNDRNLIDIWNDPEYVGLRERLQDFDFSPCTFCNSCSMAESNLEDCFGNSHSACGGCLWTQGFIQCP